MVAENKSSDKYLLVVSAIRESFFKFQRLVFFTGFRTTNFGPLKETLPTDSRGLRYNKQVVDTVETMFDRDAAVASFQRALTKLDRGDPRAIATVLEIPAVSTTKQTSQRKSDYQKTLKSSSGTDWSGVLNFWLGACEAAEKVG